MLRNPLRFAAEKGRHMWANPRAIPARTLDYAKYDMVRTFNQVFDALCLRESVVERVLARAIALKPKLLLLDEPTAGMSPEETFKTGELVKRLNVDGMTIVVIEHDMTFVRQIARKVTVLHFGQVFLEGTLDEMVHNDEVVRIYLGKE